MGAARFHHRDALVSGDRLESNPYDMGLRAFECATYLVCEDGMGSPYRVVSGRADYDGAQTPPWIDRSRVGYAIKR